MAHASWSWLHRQKYLLRACVLMAGFFLSDSLQSAESSPPREYQIKAVFLYNFVQFVEWPPAAFPGPNSPFVIGVLGSDPFGDFLDELVRNEKVNGRPLVVERYRSVDEIDNCHVLFVSGSESARAAQIAADLKGRGILTVCDRDEFARRGAIVRFVTERDRVRLRVNLEGAKAAGLTISSKLLRSAEIVSSGKD